MRLLFFALVLSALGAGSFWALTQGPLAPVLGAAAASDSTRSVLAVPPPPGSVPLAEPSAADPSQSAVQEQVTYQTYAVTGQSAEAILRSLVQNGPREGEDIFFGLTQTDLDVRYEPRAISGGCIIEDTRVSLDVVVTLPEWMPVADVDPALQAGWGRFRRALAAHEHQHRVIAVGWAETAYKAVAGLYRSSCDAAVSEARARLERLGVEVNAAHRQFDDETEHGKTTGAYWPQ